TRNSRPKWAEISCQKPTVLKIPLSHAGNGRMETHERRTRDMTETIEIQFDEDEGHLRLDCREDEFIHIRDLVVTGTSAADRLRPFRERIRSIVVRRMEAVQDPMPRRFRWELQILLVALVVSVLAVIQVIGIIALARWVFRLGS